jgi:predicted DNA repair protein MutK
MASGLAALLDDIATIAKVAAASIDDIGAAAGKAGAKAAGVVIDDTAVTPRYVTGFTPDRELPVIAKIAKGSLINKIAIILPVALLLSYFLPWAITPILMVGGAYLCFEGAEKVVEEFREEVTGEGESLAEEVAELEEVDHEKDMVAGAVRTDFILSTEIMVIALKEVSDQSIAMQAGTLFLVAIVITVAVYGVVGLIVKMDDVGLHLAQKDSGAAQARIVERIVQPPAFLAGQRGADDQVGHLHQIAQLDQVGRHAEVAVIILHLAAQQVDAVLGAFQPLGGAHDAHKIPHELADFAPALLDHDLFVCR